MSGESFVVEPCNCEQCRSGALLIRSRLNPRWTAQRTPWAVLCRGGCAPSSVVLVHLTHHEYARQLSDPYAEWECPRCGGPATFSDEEYEAWTTQMKREVAEGAS